MSQNSEWTASAAIWSTRTSLARLDNKWPALVVIALGRGSGLRFGDPSRVVYELTELGCTLHAPMRELGDWAERYAEEVLAAREAFDTAR